MRGESAKTRDLCRVLEAQGAMTYPLIGSNMQPPGWPDRIIVHAGHTFFVEFKAQRGQLTKLQERIIRELRAQGAAVFCAYFSDDGKWVGLAVEGRTWVKFTEFLKELHDATNAADQASTV